MRLTVLVMVAVASGCAVDDAHTRTMQGSTASVEMTSARSDGTLTSDLCAAASALPSTNPCAHICDPDALAAALLAAGEAPGRCYDLACTLSDGSDVFVGVCLQPEAPYGRPAAEAAGNLSHT